MNSTRPLILLTDPLERELVQKKLSAFRLKYPRTPSALRKEIVRASGLICLLKDSIQKDLLQHARCLQVVGNYAVGFDNIDLDFCRKRGIRVVNTPNVLTRSTAELALALLLSVARRIPEGEMLCRSGSFPGWSPRLLVGQELLGKKAVLVGKGRIGKQTGKLFHALGIKVSYITRKDSNQGISKKLKTAQILSLHLPYRAENHHWLNSKRLNDLPKDCILLNTSRGAIIDEKALIRCLKAQKIWGAGLDVFEHEPRIPLELRKLPQVTLLPHLGSATAQARRAMAKLVLDGVTQVLRGGKPPNLVV